MWVGIILVVKGNFYKIWSSTGSLNNKIDVPH